MDTMQSMPSILDYDDFSHDNNPFAGSNHYYSNGILNHSNNDDSDSENGNDNHYDDNYDNDNNSNNRSIGPTNYHTGNYITTQGTENIDDSYDEANNTSLSLPVSVSEQPTLYNHPPPSLNITNDIDKINQLPPSTTASILANSTSPYLIKTFEVGKDFKGSKTIFYKIENTTNSTFTLRRYNDFKSLRSYLCKFYPYLFIPPIPEKHSISRFLKNPFNYKNDLSIIELRIRLLNYFLNRINSNSQLSNSTIMFKFLDPLINNWVNCLKYPPFTNLSSNSMLLVSTKNPTKPSPYFSFLPIPPLSLLKHFDSELNNSVFCNLESKLKVFLKISMNLEMKSKHLIKSLHSLRLNLVEFGGFLNIFSIIENQNCKIEKFGNKIDLNFLNIEILINKLIIKIKEPLIILKNSISYMLQMLHFRKIKELQLIYFQNIILKKQSKLKSLIHQLKPSAPQIHNTVPNHLNLSTSSNSRSLNLAIQNMNNSATAAANSHSNSKPKNQMNLSTETKQIIKNEINTLNKELTNNLIPCFKELSNDVEFLSIQVEKNVHVEFENLINNLLLKIITDWKSNVWGEYLINCLKLWENNVVDNDNSNSY